MTKTEPALSAPLPRGRKLKNTLTGGSLEEDVANIKVRHMTKALQALVMTWRSKKTRVEEIHQDPRAFEASMTLVRKGILKDEPMVALETGLDTSLVLAAITASESIEVMTALEVLESPDDRMAVLLQAAKIIQPRRPQQVQQQQKHDAANDDAKPSLAVTLEDLSRVAQKPAEICLRERSFDLAAIRVRHKEIMGRVHESLDRLKLAQQNFAAHNTKSVRLLDPAAISERALVEVNLPRPSNLPKAFKRA